MCNSFPTMEMLKILTHKLRRQSLNEIHLHQPSKMEEDQDSGTESDEENAELEALDLAMQEPEDEENSGIHRVGQLMVQRPICCSSSPKPSVSKRPLQLVNINYPVSPLHQSSDLSPCHSGTSSPHNSSDFECCTLDYKPKYSGDFGRHSSEEELAAINCNVRSKRELHPEKRKWSQANRCGSYSEGSGSSDEEVRDLLTKSQPLKFGSSPPTGVHRLRHTLPPRLFLASVVHSNSSYTHTRNCMVSPRKRHRQMFSRDVSEATSVIQRPCLDFEKMQVGLLGMNLIY